MKAITHFRLHPIEDRKWGLRWQSDLCFDGRSLGLRVDGVLLLAQFEVPAGYLLATASDQVLKIHLLSKEFSLLDVRMITVWENSAQQFDKLLVSEDRMTFSYGSSGTWEVVMLPQPHLQMFRAAGAYGGRDFGDPWIDNRYLELHRLS